MSDSEEDERPGGAARAGGGGAAGAAPVLNKDKAEFAIKRYAQTLLGGMKLVPLKKTPLPFVAAQLALFFLPLVPGFLAILLRGPTQYVAPLVSAGVFTAVVAALQLASRAAQRRGGVAVGRNQVSGWIRDEEEADLDDGLFSAEGARFVLPWKGSWLRFAGHLAGTFLLTAGTVFYLLPERLEALFPGLAPLWWAVGALAACLAQYGLTAEAPADPAVWHSGGGPLGALARPAHILACVALDIVFVGVPQVEGANRALHVVYLLLPLLWAQGIAPQPEAALQWAAEQLLVLFHGGSPAASPARLAGSLLLAWAAVALTWVLSVFVSTQLAVAVAAPVGLVLAHDLLPGPSGPPAPPRPPALRLALDAATGAGLLALGVALHAAPPSLTALEAAGTALEAAVLALWPLRSALGRAQQPFLFGLVRNPLFPARSPAWALLHRAASGLLPPLIAFHHVLFLAAPFAYARLPEAGLPLGTSFAFAVLANRALRWPWQATGPAALDAAVVFWSARSGAIGPWWADLRLHGALLVMEFARSRAGDLFCKLRFAATLWGTVWRDKHAAGFSRGLRVAIAAGAPLGMAAAACGAAVGAPLVPLLGVPLFLFGFPRPLRAWPTAARSVAAADEAHVYAAMAPSLARAVGAAVRGGQLGDAQPGSFYLARLDAMTAWIQVLEAGRGWRRVQVKGLELQETSCHTAEATELTAVLSHGLDPAEAHAGRGKAGRLSRLNEHPLHTLRPLATLKADAYGISTVRLTGIIDSPDTLRAIHETLWKTLAWVLHRAASPAPPKHCPALLPTWLTTEWVPGHLTRPLLAAFPWDFLAHIAPGAAPGPAFSAASAPAPAPAPPTPPAPADACGGLGGAGGRGGAAALSPQRDGPAGLYAGPTCAPPTAPAPPARTSELEAAQGPAVRAAGLLAGMPPLAPPKRRTGGEELEDLLAELSTAAPPPPGPGPARPWRRGGRAPGAAGPWGGVERGEEEEEEEEEEDELERALREMDGEAAPPRKPKAKKEKAPRRQRHAAPAAPAAPAGVAPAASAPRNTGVAAMLSALDGDADGGEAPAPRAAPPRRRPAGPGRRPPAGAGGAGGGGASGHGRLRAARAAGSAALLPPRGRSGGDAGRGGARGGARGERLQGKLPPSVEAERLDKAAGLRELAVRAYRYAFKAAYDAAALGADLAAPAELAELLEEYDREWHMGDDAGPEWAARVEAGVPRLLALSKEGAVHYAKLLSLREQSFHVGALNGEGVRGLWGSLALELLYFTNDDEERFSIQAHKALLRNLTVQAAEPPLGYPVFASGPMPLPVE
eukprot:tig00001299_g8076.t1